MNGKPRRFGVRLSEILYNKFLSICAVSGKSKTEIFQELITKEYAQNVEYMKYYHEHYNKNPYEEIFSRDRR